MCQVHIINKCSFFSDTASYEEHLNSGAISNDHGSAALFIDEDGNHSLIRAMKFQTIIDMMYMNDMWETVVIHQRYSTHGEATLANTHLWQAGNYFYCHNGVLRDPDTEAYEVDSQLIGHYLKINPWEAIAYCQSEEYANTIIVGLDEKKIWVTRSVTNTLFTDGNGQYSTRMLKGEIENPMPTNTVSMIDLNIEAFDKWGFGQDYDQFGSYSYSSNAGVTKVGGTKTYEEKVAAATHGAEVKTITSNTEQNVAEIEREMDAGLPASLEDVIEIEQALHDSIANDDKEGERKYNYLLEKANGNG